MPPDPRREMLRCAADARGDIAEAALWLAAEDCPEVDVAACLEVIDQLGRELRQSLQGARGAEAVAVLHGLLRSRLGLRRSGGADPRSHYLHRVLDRGAGLPISCAAVWIAVGRRADLAVEGIGLPGHFGVSVDGVLAEPADGEILDDRAAEQLVAAATGRQPVTLHPTWLRPASTRLMLARMSRNLRGCYSSLEEWQLALRAADRCVALFPNLPSERRDRGVLRFRAGQHGAALDDLRQYLDAVPADAPDREGVEEVVARIRATMN